MKKIVYFILFLLMFAGIILFVVYQNSNYSNANAEVKKEAKADILEIKDKMFMTQINDIYINIDEYEDREVKFEGMVYNYNNNCYVIRRTPGCCGNDGIIGLEVKWDKPYFADNTWVEVEGVIKIEEKSYGAEPVIYLTSLIEKAERGIEFVTM